MIGSFQTHIYGIRKYFKANCNVNQCSLLSSKHCGEVVRAANVYSFSGRQGLQMKHVCFKHW
jgi:hypothetical protein